MAPRLHSSTAASRTAYLAPVNCIGAPDAPLPRVRGCQCFVSCSKLAGAWQQHVAFAGSQPESALQVGKWDSRSCCWSSKVVCHRAAAAWRFCAGSHACQMRTLAKGLPSTSTSCAPLPLDTWTLAACTPCRSQKRLPGSSPPLLAPRLVGRCSRWSLQHKTGGVQAGATRTPQGGDAVQLARSLSCSSTSRNQLMPPSTACNHAFASLAPCLPWVRTIGVHNHRAALGHAYADGSGRYRRAEGAAAAIQALRALHQRWQLSIFRPTAACSCKVLTIAG